jgi:hypothetical protein
LWVFFEFFWNGVDYAKFFFAFLVKKCGFSKLTGGIAADDDDGVGFSVIGDNVGVAVVSPSKGKHGRDDDYDDDASDCAKRSKEGYELSIEVWKAEGANGDGQTKMFVDELVEKGSSGLSSKLVPFVAEKAPTSIVSVCGAVGAAAIGWGLDLEGVSVANVADVWNPMMRKIFGDLLAEVDIAYVPGLDYWLSASADPTKAGFEPSTSPDNMFCSLFPEVTNKPSPGVNHLYQNEFIDDGNGPVRYNDKFGMVRECLRCRRIVGS